MPDPAARPDPDALLERLQAEEKRKALGRLKIFFGFAPGVGKTYAMLESARRLVAQGVDVVVGIVETHGRPETAALLEGLEVLPRRQVAYRGVMLEELDLDAARARRPAVLLVDELAHTNAPGSRYAKRWQDVMELIELGITVHTTLNVQHLESLNDVVAQITTVRVRETIPDAVVERADEIELVDLPPGELLQRLREGKVYIPEVAARAVQRFFQQGNLLALRELALRRTADHVEDDVREYREAHRIEATWPAGERILVCVGPAPASARLVRAASRIAAGLRAPWIAAYVEPPTPLSKAGRERLEAHLALAESLGAQVVRLSGDRVAPAILDYARRHNVTRIVLGKPTRTRLRDRVRGSMLDEVVRGSGDIEVHAISGDPGAAAEEVRAAPRERTGPGPYAATVALVAAATGVGFLGRDLSGLPAVAMLYLLVITIVAVRYGRGPSLVASALSVTCFDFFFIPPYYTFVVDDARHLITFAAMFVVGLLISGLTLRMRRKERAALHREERTSALYTLSRSLGKAVEETEAAEVAAEEAAAAFGTSAVVFLAADGFLEPCAQGGPPLELDAQDGAVARWVFEHNRPAGFGTGTLPGARMLAVPLQAGGDTVGVLALHMRGSGPLTLDQRQFLEAFARPVALAIARARLAEEAKTAALRARAEEMRSTLLSSLSHDLRTPLATITGSASALREGSHRLSEEQRHELLEAVSDEAERLDRLVENLLDMTRFDAGAVVPRREWIPIEEIVGAALTRLDKRLSGHVVVTDLPADLPLASGDPVLLEQLLFNLLENAAKYTPAGTEVRVGARVEDGTLVVEVSDRGPGLPPGDEERVFEKFYRGPHAGISGAGLGLPICRAIAEAHGGTLTASAHAGGGSTFRLTLPLPGAAPEVPTMAPETPGEGP